MSQFAGAADHKRIERWLLDAVSISSVNPIFGGPGEAVLAAAVADELALIGFTPTMQTVAPSRENVIVMLSGVPGAPTLAFEAHLDTVGLSGESQAHRRAHNGRVLGRGACDAKGVLVSMMEAVRLLSRVPIESRATVLFTAAVDEESGQTGVKKLLAERRDIDLAVVGEPTGLANAIVHRGVLRFRIRTVGIPAHASRPDVGVNAIYEMAKVLDSLENELIPALAKIQHPLAGSPTFAVTEIGGGTAHNVVPAECTIGIDRRLNPGEEPRDALAAVDALIARLCARGVGVIRDEPFLIIPGLDGSPTDRLARAMAEARLRVLGVSDGGIAVPYTSDASWFAQAGIPAVVFGPGSIDQAHGNDEWVDLEEVARGAEILAELACLLAQDLRAQGGSD